MKDVLLLSGLGPMFGLAAGDLVGTRFDQRISQEDLNRYYTLDGELYDPMELEVELDNGFQRLLRTNIENKPRALVTDVLENILRKNGIDFTSLSLSEVWSGGAMSPAAKKSVSIVCLSTTFMWSTLMLDTAINWIKERYTFKYLVLGGKYAALKKDRILRDYSVVDYIITGDGEETMPALIHYLQTGIGDPETIPNLAFYAGERLVLTQIKEIDISAFSPPRFSPNSEVIMYESVRGCVFHCKFCAWSTGCEQFRYKSASQIYNEWKEYTTQCHAQEIQVIDSNFFIPAKRMKELLPQLPDLHVRWKANARTDIPINEGYVDQLERSGCVSLKFGFESMSDKILGYINKKSTAANNRRVNRFFSRSSIDTIGSFIVGFPGETPEDFAETAEYLIHEHYGHFHLYVFELEDECMPIWEDREKFRIQLLDSNDQEDDLWTHGGSKWSHCGMDSATAEELKRKILRRVRLSDSKAVHRTWQGRFAYPLIKEKDRAWNLSVERLIDRLVYLPVDYAVGSEAYKDALKDCVASLRELGVCIRHDNNET